MKESSEPSLAQIPDAHNYEIQQIGCGFNSLFAQLTRASSCHILCFCFPFSHGDSDSPITLYETNVFSLSPKSSYIQSLREV